MEQFSELSGLNAYEILGVSPRASATEITAAWKDRIGGLHPDRGGSPRMAQLTNDAKTVLLTRRAEYDDWLWRAAAPAGRPTATTAASPSEPEVYEDPWDRASLWRPNTRRAPMTTPPAATGAPPAPPSSAPAATGGVLALVVAAFLAPIGLWLGIRSLRWRGVSLAAVLAVVVGSLGTLYLGWVALGQAGLLAPRTPPPQVVKQGALVVDRSTDVTLDEEGGSFRPSSEEYVSFTGTRRGLTFPAATRVPLLPEGVTPGFDGCQQARYPEPEKRTLTWKKLPEGTLLCVTTAGFHTSLLSVTDQNARSVKLQITTWDR
jgi:hypothetical protein